MIKIKLILKEITDTWVKKNFLILTDYIVAQKILQDWVFLEVDFAAAAVNKKIRHSLTCVPKDIIETSKTGAGSVTFNYDLFDKEFLDITTTGPCKLRFFVGNVTEV